VRWSVPDMPLEFGRSPVHSSLMPLHGTEGVMNLPMRYGAIGLPVVDVDFVLQRLKDQRTTRLLLGTRRQVVDKVVQMLTTAKRNQLNSLVELDVEDVGLLLQAMASTVEGVVNICHDWFNEDDEQI